MKRRGFTLIETIITLSVLAIIGGVAFTGVMRVADLTGDADRSITTGLDGWSALARIADDITHAATVVTPTSGATGGTLTLTRDAGSYDGCPSCVDRSLAISYQLDGATGRLTRTGDGVATPLLDNATSLLVASSGGAAVTRLYTITLSVAPTGDRPHTFVTAVRPLRAATGTWQEILP